ncbi:hypothetical protein LINPERPRIM_LOCUS16481, partial [Linum perenne]
TTSSALQTGINSEFKRIGNHRKKVGAELSSKMCGFQRQMCAGAHFECQAHILIKFQNSRQKTQNVRLLGVNVRRRTF